MKKIIAFTLLFSIALFSSCGKSAENTNSDSEKKLKIVATSFPSFDFARQIAGSKADIIMLLPPGAESHSYEPSPQDIIAIQNSDVFLYIGGESDAWVNKIIKSMDTSKMRVVPLIDSVEAVEEVIAEGMQEEEEEDGDSDEKEYDEHIWTSPRNAILMVKKIAEVVEAVDPSNASFYDSNAKKYIKELNALDGDFVKVVKNSKRKVIVFGDRFPFRYFADAYGLKYFAAFPGCSNETEANPATLKFLIDKVKSEKIPVIFHIELSNENIAKAIAGDTGAKIMLLHSAHNISRDDFKKGITYLDLMKGNVETLKEALK
jgi:zinc transport system substrate-binding protein